jgi:hypothetical protein
MSFFRAAFGFHYAAIYVLFVSYMHDLALNICMYIHKLKSIIIISSVLRIYLLGNAISIVNNDIMTMYMYIYCTYIKPTCMWIRRAFHLLERPVQSICKHLNYPCIHAFMHACTPKTYTCTRACTNTVMHAYAPKILIGHSCPSFDFPLGPSDLPAPPGFAPQQGEKVVLSLKLSSAPFPCMHANNAWYAPLKRKPWDLQNAFAMTCCTFICRTRLQWHAVHSFEWRICNHMLC